ncbi:MAG: isopeptide-forming domain-containing fimbrial protein [Streptococcus sp.]|uniref:isopeptide-forming domain-containing fimbrial protein n=1 Tax=Streptococcus sp. TaxID=1306 RepID=UPI00258B2FAF|nr:isopeptide-forming domain-containing fimbrial protein [Streptococcus sp.]MCR5052957.1 isopeptide-forming domain-containing fimbrial protein [Streptococcus sp.]
MKKLKLIFATLLSVLFAFTGGGKAFADDSTYTLTINGTTIGHTYEVYQVFNVQVADDGTTLSDVSWGSGVTPFSYAGISSMNPKEIADSLGSEDNSAVAKSFAASVAANLRTATTSVTASTTSVAIPGLTAGYYLVKDANEDSNFFLVAVTKDITATVKNGTPTVEKKVKDTNDTTGETSDWQDSADYDINDSVPFQLTATLPSNLDDYTEYYLEFSDTLSSGLTYNKDAKVYLDNDGARTDVTSAFTIADDGSSFKIDNLKSLDGVTSSTKVIVEYTATLNENAVIGSAGNPNTVKLIYSNNPGSTGKGETPEDTVIVFTYKVIVNKVDQDGKALAGAGFTLYKKVNDTWKQIGDEITGVTTFEFKGLDDGDYKLSETTTPAGYNTISDIGFRIRASHKELSDSPTLDQLSWLNLGTLIPVNHAQSIVNGSFTFDVINKKGTVLPSTGGMGTTLLYVVGTILVLAAGALLVTKKHVSVN